MTVWSYNQLELPERPDQPTRDEMVAALRREVEPLLDSYPDLDRWWTEATDGDRELFLEAFDLDADRMALAAIDGVVLDEARERRVA